MSKEIEERLVLFKKAAMNLRGMFGSKARGYLAGYYGDDYVPRKFEDLVAFEKGKELGKKDKESKCK